MKLSKAFSTSELNQICSMRDEEFFNTKYGKVTAVQGCNHLFIDNGGSVLAVAHADTAIGHRSLGVISHRGLWLGVTPSLDDRLGIYTIVNLLPKMGLVYDVLITDNEEIGQSTASDFKPEKEYNWMFQFDRRGTGLVMYDYETPELVEMFKRFGLETHVGSFSDICYLDHLGVAGFNIGTAYYSEHTQGCYVDFDEYLEQVGKFINFFNAKSKTKFAHTPKPKVYRGWNKYWNDYKWDGKSYLNSGAVTQDDEEYYTGYYNKVYVRRKMLGGGTVSMWVSVDAYYKMLEDFPEESIEVIAGHQNLITEEELEEGNYTDAELWVVCPTCGVETAEEDFSFSLEMCFGCVSKLNDRLTGL